MRRTHEEERRVIQEQLEQDAEIKRAEAEERAKEAALFDDFLELDFDDDWRDRWRQNYLDDSLKDDLEDEDLWDRLDRRDEYQDPYELDYDYGDYP